jgi:hypothetical protein
MEFHPAWLEEQNEPRTAREQITPAEAAIVLADLREAFDRTFPDELARAEFPLATESTAEVLILKPRVHELRVSLPHTARRNPQSTTTRAGRAALEVELRDAPSGQLLARFRDRRDTREMLAQVIDDRAMNIREFGLLFSHWARRVASEIRACQARMPPPPELVPNQKPPD